MCVWQVSPTMTANAECSTHARTRPLSFMPPTASSPTPQHFTGLKQVSWQNTEFSCKKKKTTIPSCLFSRRALHCCRLQEQEAAALSQCTRPFNAAFGLSSLCLETATCVDETGLLVTQQSPDFICVSPLKWWIRQTAVHVGRFPQFAYKWAFEANVSAWSCWDSPGNSDN